MNNYTFHCPVKKDATNVTHCQEVHSNSMQGYPDRTEDKICALAHLCYMCPFRNAVSVGGIWAHPDKMPFSEKAQESPAKLPRDLVKFALTHTTPKDSDYRRAGLWGDNVRCHDALFRELQEGALNQFQTPSQVARYSSASAAPSSRAQKKAAPKKKETAIDAMTSGYNKNEMAEAVSELAAEERQKHAEKGKSADKQSVGKKPAQRTEKRAQSAPDSKSSADKPMTLAERAKAMKASKK